MASLGANFRCSWLAIAVTVLLSGAAWLGDLVHFATVEDSSPERLEEAIHFIRSEFKAGDGVIVSPYWDERPLVGLMDMGPGTDQFPFPAIPRGESSDPMRLLKFERIWMLATFGHTANLLGLASEDYRVSTTHRFGDNTSVVLYDILGPTVHASLTKDIRRLKALRRLTDGEIVACPFDDGALKCGLEKWLDLRIEHRDVAGQEVSWLYAHAGPDNGKLYLTWTPRSPGAAILLRSGLTQSASRHDAGATCMVSISMNEEKIDSFDIPPTAYGLERRLYKLSSNPSQVSILIEIETEDSSWRQLMFEMDALETVPQSIEDWATHRSEVIL